MSGFESRLNWCRRKRCLTVDIPEAYKKWLFDDSSLTAKLISKCDGKFRVEVLSEKRSTPTPDEIQVLGIRYRSQAIIRQVLLYCNDKPWVYARSVIPMTSLTGSLKRLSKLGNKPLGAVLFSNKNIKRQHLEVTVLDESYPGYKFTRQKNNNLVYGRRSIFTLYRKSVLVSEFFLSDIVE